MKTITIFLLLASSAYAQQPSSIKKELASLKACAASLTAEDADTQLLELSDASSTCASLGFDNPVIPIAPTPITENFFSRMVNVVDQISSRVDIMEIDVKALKMEVQNRPGVIYRDASSTTSRSQPSAPQEPQKPDWQKKFEDKFVPGH